MDVLTFARLFTRYNVMSCIAEHVAKLGVCRANVGIMSGLCRDYDGICREMAGCVGIMTGIRWVCRTKCRFMSRNSGRCRENDGNV